MGDNEGDGGGVARLSGGIDDVHADVFAGRQNG